MRLALNLALSRPGHETRAASSPHLCSSAGGLLAPTAARMWTQRAWAWRTRAGLWSQLPSEGMEPRLPESRAVLSTPPRVCPAPAHAGTASSRDSDPGACPSGPWFSSCDSSADAGFAVGGCQPVGWRGSLRLYTLRPVFLPLPCPSRVLLPADWTWSTSCSTSGLLLCPALCAVLPAGCGVLASVQSPQS